jgi:hypothetical protein
LRRWILLASLLAGCANIIDLEDRKVDADGGVGGGALMGDCNQYCEESMALCTKERSVESYSSLDACKAVCAVLPTTPSLTGNTLACRLDQLDKLKGAPAEAPAYCSGAGPGGGPAMGEPATSGCGTTCEGYCQIRAQICPEVIERDCLTKCQALPSVPNYNAAANFGDGQDSVECRLAHLSAAAMYGSMNRPDDRKNHCAHSGIRSEVQCDVNGEAKLRCEDYCKLTFAACSGDAAVYETVGQCEKFCTPRTKGTQNDNTTVGTIRCSRAGAYDALELGVSQCPNAGPAPDRCGRGRCQSYCLLAKEACPDGFAASFASADDCENKCRSLPDSAQNSPYAVSSLAAKGTNSLQCRLLRLTRLLAGEALPAETCPAVFGAGDCK